jgi:hypothetical protein
MARSVDRTRAEQANPEPQHVEEISQETPEQIRGERQRSCGTQRLELIEEFFRAGRCRNVTPERQPTSEEPQISGG